MTDGDDANLRAKIEGMSYDAIVGLLIHVFGIATRYSISMGPILNAFRKAGIPDDV